MKRHQKGLTFGGLLIFMLLVGFVAYTASRLLPAYLDYWAVKKTLADLARDPDLKEASLPAYRDAVDRRLQINNISAVSAADLKLERQPEGTRLQIAWTVRKPFIGPVNLCLDFKAEAEAPRR